MLYSSKNRVLEEDSLVSGARPGILASRQRTPPEISRSHPYRVFSTIEADMHLWVMSLRQLARHSLRKKQKAFIAAYSHKDFNSPNSADERQ